jgi:hypothetical protein
VTNFKGMSKWTILHIKRQMQLSMVAPVCNHRRQRSGGSLFETSQAKIIRLHLTQWLGMVVCLSFQLHGEAQIGRSWSKHKLNPSLKNNQCKIDWGSGSSDRAPTLQCKALSSTTSINKRQRMGGEWEREREIWASRR